METSEALGFVRDNTWAVLATTRRDGTPQQSPVTLGVVDDTVVMSSRDTAYKVKNLRRDPRAWLCVVTNQWLGPWVQLSCTAEVVSGEAAVEPLVDYYRAVAGEHPDWDEYRQVMRDDRRCIVRFTIDAAGPDRSG